jgi:hypothetical protein
MHAPGLQVAARGSAACARENVANGRFIDRRVEKGPAGKAALDRLADVHVAGPSSTSTIARIRENNETLHPEIGEAIRTPRNRCAARTPAGQYRKVLNLSRGTIVP